MTVEKQAHEHLRFASPGHVRQGYALAYRRYSTKYVPEEDQARAAWTGI